MITHEHPTPGVVTPTGHPHVTMTAPPAPLHSIGGHLVRWPDPSDGSPRRAEFCCTAGSGAACRPGCGHPACCSLISWLQMLEPVYLGSAEDAFEDAPVTVAIGCGAGATRQAWWAYLEEWGCRDCDLPIRLDQTRCRSCWTALLDAEGVGS